MPDIWRGDNAGVSVVAGPAVSRAPAEHARPLRSGLKAHKATSTGLVRHGASSVPALSATRPQRHGGDWQPALGRVWEGAQRPAARLTYRAKRAADACGSDVAGRGAGLLPHVVFQCLAGLPHSPAASASVVTQYRHSSSRKFSSTPPLASITRREATLDRSQVMRIRAIPKVLRQ